MSPTARILVVEHERTADVGLFGERMTAAGAAHDVRGPEAGAPLPGSVVGYDGVIVLGGTPGPADDDRAPWLPQVRALIRQCLELEVPYLGLCLGGQLLAHVAGGRVVDARRGPEVGVLPVERTYAAHDDPLLGGLPGVARSVQWHWLEVAELPAGARSLMASERCPNQAFRVGPVAWATQFHPEALARTVRGWAGADRDNLAPLGLDPESLVSEAEAAEGELRATWAPIADRWIRLCSRTIPAR